MEVETHPSYKESNFGNLDQLIVHKHDRPTYDRLTNSAAWSLNLAITVFNGATLAFA